MLFSSISALKKSLKTKTCDTRFHCDCLLLYFLVVPVPHSAPALSSPATGGWCWSSPAQRCCSLAPPGSPAPPAGSPAGCGSPLSAPPALRSPAACYTESPPPTTWLLLRGSFSHCDQPENSTSLQHYLQWEFIMHLFSSNGRVRAVGGSVLHAAEIFMSKSDNRSWQQQ